MKDNLILQDKNYISAKRAAEVFGYTSDYVGQLCRAGKLECKMIGKSWFVSEESLAKHQLSTHPELAQKISHVIAATQSQVVTEVSPTSVQNPAPTQALVPVTIPVIAQVAVAPAVEVLVPKAEKMIDVPVATPFQPLSFVPRNFSLPNYISPMFLTAPDYRPSTVIALPEPKIMVTTVFCIISLFLMFQSLTSNTNVVRNISNSSIGASVITNSGLALRKIASIFSEVPHIVTDIFKNDSKLATSQAPQIIQNGFNGIAVAPSTNSRAQDEIIKNRIRQSFSDDVTVRPDITGTAGVITPVFRKANGDDFIYVLVPVQNTN